MHKNYSRECFQCGGINIRCMENHSYGDPEDQVKYLPDDQCGGFSCSYINNKVDYDEDFRYTICYDCKNVYICHMRCLQPLKFLFRTSFNIENLEETFELLDEFKLYATYEECNINDSWKEIQTFEQLRESVEEPMYHKIVSDSKPYFLKEILLKIENLHLDGSEMDTFECETCDKEITFAYN